MQAPLHPCEADRLQALRSYDIVDTEFEAEFDEVVDFVRAVCDVPIVLISLVAEERQWFKARRGLDVDETPRDVAICAYTVLQDDILEIGDTLLDPRTRDNRLCTQDPDLRFYAGMPLVTKEGFAIGSLCALDHRPRVLTDLQRQTLRVMAHQVMARLELRRTLRLARELRGEVDHRVKNSLQSLAALASIKARNVASDEGREALQAIQRRIQTVAMLHEQLYRSDSGSAVNLGGYLTDVARYLEGQTPDRVSILCEACDLAVVAEQSAAIGTLVNEFVANSIKHGYPDGRRGNIRVGLRQIAPDEACLELSDDGIGLPEGGVTRKGLGLQIMEASAAQAAGQYEQVPVERGFAVAVRFQPRASRAIL
ncbi:histidine kinase dimerization/phosphoacceptor domain -containing protein [Thioclava sp. GXIMD4216]|uniref:histidine kinase n=1 Tax=Thioclava litoralis TaxID=3076557 RepID=A0ABZ1DZK4_9RHOB|nr:histidine kinase dimerization/phosphoacceptor domain -containing protein [Thioclava sp. FTW29]